MLKTCHRITVSNLMTMNNNIRQVTILIVNTGTLSLTKTL